MADTKNRRRLVTLRRIGLVLVALAVLVGLVVVLWPRHRETVPKDAAFVVDGQAYTRQQVANLTRYATSRGADPDQMARQAFDLLKRQRAAEQLGLKVSDQRVEQIARDNYDAKRPDDPWVRLLASDDALNEVLGRLGKQGRVEGYVFFFNFSRYLLHGPAYTPPHLGDTKRIAADRAYAKRQAEHDRSALAEGKLGPEQVIREITSDARLGEMGIKGFNESGRFAGGRLIASGQRDERNLPPEVADFVQRADARPGLSGVRTGRALVDAAITHPTGKDYADSYFYVVKITAVDHGQSPAGFERTLRRLSARYLGLDAKEAA